MMKKKQEKNKLGVFSTGIMKKPQLTSFLAVAAVCYRPQLKDKVDLVAGWGRKPNTKSAVRFARRHQIPYLILEDGFLHSCGQGVLGDPACSLVVDASGIYYDATTASDLETSLVHKDYSQQQTQRAKQCIRKIRHDHISKYNNTPFDLSTDLLPQGDNILVVDQTAGDMSLKYAYATRDTFQQMLEAALAEHPNANIIIKTHPDVIAGKKKGCLPLTKDHPRLFIIADNINPLALIKQMNHVYVATSQMGFEALILGKPVTCFGVPFYAGWGLTDDRADQPLAVWKRRATPRTLEQVFHAAYIDYSRYVHPDTLVRCEIEDILDYFSLQQSRRQITSGRLFCFGFSLWKRQYIRRFLQSPDNEIQFISCAKQAMEKGFDSSCQIITWSSKDKTEAKGLSQPFNVPITAMEDGFIRSVGIGSDLTAPASLVIDHRGIYYDPHHASDLEYMLQHASFDRALLKRAANLRALLIEHQISKYNSGHRVAECLINPMPQQRIVLIPGQVEDDASIKKGGIDISTNQALIIAVRQAHPNAYLIYKPHPDVISGNRQGQVDPTLIEQHCDLMLEDISITDCLALVDEVHTMTSLVGFEGLLRQLKVVCYGLPFYSNWGLTQDRHPLARRNPDQNNAISLDQLVAATLILYPRYINWQTGAFTTPEFIVQQINHQIIEQGGKQGNKMPLVMRKFYQGIQLIKGLLLR